MWVRMGPTRRSVWWDGQILTFINMFMTRRGFTGAVNHTVALRLWCVRACVCVRYFDVCLVFFLQEDNLYLDIHTY